MTMVRTFPSDRVSCEAMARTGHGASRFLFRALNETNLGIVVSNVEFWRCPLNDDGGVTEAQTKNPAS